MLPTADEIGESRVWAIPNGTGEVEVEAQFIGLGSSHNPYHLAHPVGSHAEVGQKCQACRWLEIRIFDDDDTYLVSYVGVSVVPGETQRSWYMTAKTEDDLMDLLSGDGRSGKFFSKPARLAIESARGLVPEIGDAYSEHPGHPDRSR